mgnify:CR=1 FL=1
MKTLKSLLITLVITLLSIQIYAERIPKHEAETVATHFVYKTTATYYQAMEWEDIRFEESYTFFASGGEEAYYIFNLAPSGFVIVAAETAMRPILGYSLEGGYNEADNNQVFQSWMQSHVDAINYIRENNIEPNPEMEAKWATYLKSEPAQIDIPARSGRDVEPLLTNTWNQDYPYNAYCPEDEDGPGDHAYAGCVATAMSMIMYHYKYPEHGYGTHSYYIYPYGTQSANFGETYYMWDAMLDDLTGTSPEHSILSIAELQYQCAVSVNMNFSPDGSGSYSYLVPNAIKEYFGYSDDAVFLSKNDYSLTEWTDMIAENLENDHPIYYSGQSTEGGHAFALDGMQGSSMFHFNFGWSGSMSGYYPLEGTGAVGGYNQDQGMVKDFYPPEDEYPYECANDTLYYLAGTIDDGAMPYKAYETDAECRWLLVSPTAQDSIDYFEFEFLDFDLEEGDYIRFYDGATEDSELLGEYTGTSTPGDFNSTNDSVLIVFETDGNETDHHGFRLKYEIDLPSYCTGVSNFTEPTGTFDDGSGLFNYNNNSVCQYIIDVPDAIDLTIFFDEFNLGEGDRLLVYQTNPSALLGELTSEDDPEPLTSESGSMMITMQTDNLYNGGGFTISYQIGNIGIDKNELFSDFTLSPNPASDILNVSLRADQEEDLRMQIHNTNGKTLLTGKIQNQAGAFSSDINVSDFKPGIYILSIYAREGIMSKRFIVK